MVSAVQSPPLDLDPAIKEMTRGYDLAVQLHCILLAQAQAQAQPQKAETRSMTLDLAEMIVRAFKTSLDVLKPQAKPSTSTPHLNNQLAAPNPPTLIATSSPHNADDAADTTRK
jgi:hypothetical protein